jgi:ADP-heptose:LPS heptosyltransferase
MNVTVKILIHRLGSLGDFVVALPSFHLIRRAFPDAKLVLMTNYPGSKKEIPAMDVLAGSGLCDDSFAYPIALRSPHELLALRRKIKPYSFDLAVQLNSNRGRLYGSLSHLFLRSCGVRKIVGNPRGVADMPYRRCRDSIVEQESSRLTRRLRSIGQIELSDRASWDLCLSLFEREAATSLLREQSMPCGFIVASVGTKVLAKDWGAGNWEKLAATVSKRHSGLGLVLVGVAEEYARSEVVRMAWAGPSLNLCGKCSPRVSASVLEHAALFVGHDSGPMHLAAVVGAPVVAIFSWHNPPGQWFPGCIGWPNIKVLYPPLPAGIWEPGLRLERSPSRGILSIGVEEVAQECSKLLGGSGN